MDILSDPVEQIIHTLKNNQWDAQLYDGMAEVAEANPAKILQLIKTGISEVPKGVTLISDAVSYAQLADLPKLAVEALEVFRENPKNECAADIISHISLQFPQCLHPHLTTIFELGVNRDSYFHCFPWRESGKTGFAHLKQVLAVDTDSETDVLSCLLETRHFELMDYAVAWIRNAKWEEGRINHTLHEVGFHLVDDDFRQLYPDITFHLVFDQTYLNKLDRPSWQLIHPTWHLDADGLSPQDFGGWAAAYCAGCGNSLHHLITLSPISPQLGIKGLGCLSLATCLSCLGNEQSALFYRHDSTGQPMQIGYEGEKVRPAYVYQPLAPTKVLLSETLRRWIWQDWGISNSRQNLHRVGGHPSWVQSAEYLCCVQCHQTMRFLLQLDSDLPTVDGSNFLWGSGGIGYVFWCDACKVSGFTWQCT